MSFQDNLPDLDTSARFFDDRRSNYPPSPVKQKAREIYNKDFCLKKRPSRFFDDDSPNFFAITNVPQGPFKAAKPFPPIFNELEPAQEKELVHVQFAEVERDLKVNQLSHETQEPATQNDFKIKITKPRPKPVESKPKTPEPKIEKPEPKPEKPKKPERKKSADELNNLQQFNTKYSDCIKERQGKNNTKKRKKNVMYSKYPPQMRSKISKVHSFWNGKSSFIPHVFRVIDFKRDRKGKLLEYLDYSLKGLSHEYGELTGMRSKENQV